MINQHELLTTAARLLVDVHCVVVFTGAGVSAESGVGTFRDALTGLWSRFDPQQLASQEGFAADPGLVWRWYIERLTTIENARPNRGHEALAAMEKIIPEFVLVTQNVDDLHERAGNRHVLHLHGHIGRFRCNGCGAAYSLRAGDREALMPPCCTICTGYVRPAVVWFGEMLPEQELFEAWGAAERCDVMLVVGASGVVYPAAQLPAVAQRHGACIIEVNLEESALSELADITLIGPSGEILPRLLDAMYACEAKSAFR
ncbi:MAG: NAD-dependent protein deacylase 1 [Chloroflexota bacterium]|nr:NAD-dependent deacylase [Caldilinea sp.]GIK71826.1 MAG: NAD-dependent protein deacylase 1 [Chloroflexota bacterium]